MTSLTILRIFSEITRDLLYGGSGEDVVIVKAKCFAQLLAQLDKLLETLLNHLLSLRNVLGHSTFMFPNAGCTLGLIKLHLETGKCFNLCLTQ